MRDPGQDRQPQELVRAWRRVKSFRFRWRNSNIPEGILLSSLDRGVRWKLYLLYPGLTIRRFRWSLHMRAPLPGERFYNPALDTMVQFLGFDRGYARLRVRTGLHVHLYGADSWNQPLPNDTIDVTEQEWRRQGWLPWD